MVVSKKSSNFANEINKQTNNNSKKERNNMDFVKGKYVEFYTDKYFKEKVEKEFSDEKFEVMYNNHPSRMTPMQIKGMGGRDIVRSRLLSQWIDTKYQSYYNALLEVSNQVINQLVDAIYDKYPNVKVEISNGEVKKYGENKFRATKVYVGDYDNGKYITIKPTINDKDNNYFALTYHVENTEWNDICRGMNDEQALAEIGKLVHYINTNELLGFGNNKVQLWCENQYEVCFGERKLRLHDTQMILLYHCVARDMNKLYGTNYKWSQKIIDKLYKHSECTTNAYLGCFTLSKYSYNNKAKLGETYYYENRETKKPTFQCQATYGEWSKEELACLLDTLYPYVNSRYFYETSKESFKEKYDSYDRIGVRYSSRPNYFDLLLWED